MKKKILVLAGYYLPGVKGGGPIQSIKNMVDNLKDDFDFYIIANDRDLGDKTPFEKIQFNKWIQVGNAKVYYINSREINFKKMRRIINGTPFDVLYINSFFSYEFSIIPILLKKFKMININKVVLAPRGGFYQGALSLKSKKKYLYIKMAKVLNLYKGIFWHATAEIEREDINSIYRCDENIIVVNNLTTNYEGIKYSKMIRKKEGELKIVFISRIHPKKNLLRAIEFLGNIDGEIELNIYGPVEDNDYWLKCKRKAGELPSNVNINYYGVAPHSQINNIFKQNHVFLFPTLGENFGHIISEALIGGCPIIISDQTPWGNLEEISVGWDIPLKNEFKFIEVIQKCINLNNQEYMLMSKNAFDYGKEMSNLGPNIEKTYKLFD